MIKSHFYPYGQNTRTDPISVSALFFLDWRAVWICASFPKDWHFPLLFWVHFAFFAWAKELWFSYNLATFLLIDKSSLFNKQSALITSLVQCGSRHSLTQYLGLHFYRVENSRC